MQAIDRKTLEIRDCKAIVMATHAEYLDIWCRVSHQSPWRDTSLHEQPKRILWEQQCIGSSHRIGEIAGHPLVLYAIYAWLDGEPVAFVRFGSRFADLQTAETWLMSNAAPGAKIEDAMNWRNALRD